MKTIKLAMTVVILFTFATGASATDTRRWVAAWGYPPVTLGPPPAAPIPSAAVPAVGAAAAAPPTAATASRPIPVLNNVTVRHIMRVSTGGDAMRVRLSNEFGVASLRVGAMHVALVDEQGAVVPGSDRTVTFNRGATSVTIPSFAPMISDEIPLKVTARQRVAVSVFLPEETRTPAHRTLVSLAQGDKTMAADLAGYTAVAAGTPVSQIEVRTNAVQAVVVAFGDSITDGGSGSTALLRRSWPDSLADRIATSPYAGRIAVINAGIGGNRLLREGSGPAALARFDRDVLSVPGVTHVIVLEAINDIGNGMRRPPEDPSLQDLIGAYQQMILRAHEKGVKIYGATLTPYGGAGYQNEAGEAKREALNDWIRAPGHFDAYIDFEKSVRDPASPTKWAQGVQSGDNLHPNAVGYDLMAGVIDLKMFGATAAAPVKTMARARR